MSTHIILMNTKYFTKLFLGFFLPILVSSCIGEKTEPHYTNSTSVSVEGLTQSKTVLSLGEALDVQFSLRNDSNYTVVLESADLILFDNYTGTRNIVKEGVVNSITIAPNEKSGIILLDDALKVETPSLETHFCTLKLRMKFPNDAESEVKLVNFRVISGNSLTTYKIMKQDYNGLPVYSQKGDMSAGFAVSRSLMNLQPSMAGTYLHTEHGGPYAVYATPDFLQNAIEETVNLYNKECGANTKISTVVIGTGLTSVNYLLSSTDAAFLPLHFLVSANSTKEVADILDKAAEHGNPSFATFGYDASMPGVGVAWIKMFGLPTEYLQFIKDHQVEKIILFGMDEKVAGESLARKVLRHPDEKDKGYEEGSIFILYTNYGSPEDLAAIKGRIYDYDELCLGKEHHICDWESGITQEQIDKVTEGITSGSKAEVYLMNSPSDVNLSMYSLASFLQMQWMKKNNIQPQGFILNEYLTCYPSYELQRGWVPLLYWQFIPASSTVERLNTLKTALGSLFPDIPMDNYYADKDGYLNSGWNRENLYVEMLKLGFKDANVRYRLVTDHWNPEDDDFGNKQEKVSAVEEFSYDIVNSIGVDEYKNKVKDYLPLTIEDLEAVRDLMNTSGMDMKIEKL